MENLAQKIHPKNKEKNNSCKKRKKKTKEKKTAVIKLKMEGRKLF